MCVHVLYKCFIPYLNVWQAMMFCAMCLFELIKKCLILSYLISYLFFSSFFLSLSSFFFFLFLPLFLSLVLLLFFRVIYVVYHILHSSLHVLEKNNATDLKTKEGRMWLFAVGLASSLLIYTYSDLFLFLFCSIPKGLKQEQFISKQLIAGFCCYLHFKGCGPEWYISAI